MTIEEFAKRSAQRAYLEKKCIDADTVSRKLFDQIKWERDLAIRQLEELGYGLGEVIKTQKLSNNSPKLNNENGELISRQAAIECLEHLSACDEPFVEIGTGDETFIGKYEAITEISDLPSAQPELCEDAVSRQRLLSDLKELVAAWKKYPVMTEQIKGVEAAIGYVESIPSVKPNSKELSLTQKELDTISRQDAIDVLGVFTQADALGHTPKQIVEALPSAEPEPLSDAYMKSVWTWLLDYQIKVAKLKGRYTPYEVLSWVANDWRKEHE